MSCVGLKQVVEVQFADYIWPGLNQLFTELSRSAASYQKDSGQFTHSSEYQLAHTDQSGPYHSSSVESVLSNIRGIKVAYPSNGADLKGLIKAAFHDPNPVVMLEHKGLYWSKIPGTEEAKCIEPSEDYIVPLGKARTVIEVSPSDEAQCSIITYGRGVYWAKEAAEKFKGLVEIIDLESIVPVDINAISKSVLKTNRCLVTEEPVENSFGLSLCGRIAAECFESLDAAPLTLGSISLPAIPLKWKKQFCRILKK